MQKFDFFSCNYNSSFGLLKLFKITVENKNSILENLLLIIDYQKVLKINHLLIFVNLKQYLKNKELEELYKYAIYNEVSLLLIDSQTYGISILNEKKQIIDDNLDEIMLK